jgi:hypothetical protein
VSQEEFKQGDEVEWNTAGQDPRHGKEEAHLAPRLAARRSPPLRTAPLPGPEREDRQRGSPQARRVRKGLGG